jgi:hypothetical protein
MTQPAHVFRDFGIIPDRVQPPRGVVRAYFSWGHVFGQYLASALMSAFGLGIATLFAFTLPWPVNVLAALGFVIGTAALICLVGRNDYVWVELDGDTLRARHLYTGRQHERSIADIDHVQTLVLQYRNLSTTILDSLLGRVRGFKVHFRDGRWPLLVSRVDPKMTNAQQLMEAIIYRMSQHGELDAEVVDHLGSPLVKKIFWGKRAEA